MKLDFVIFGGIGDLSLRKLLPSLYFLYRDGNLPADSHVLCVSRGELSGVEFKNLVEAKLKEFLKQEFDTVTFGEFIQILSYLKMDLTNSSDWQKLSGKLTLSNTERNIVYYMSVPPTLFATVCQNLNQNNLNPRYSKVVVEKPLGEDFQSAFSINKLLGEAFSEKQIYRIDHYLGKKAVQDISKMRFGNVKLDKFWNKNHIEEIWITVSETVGVEGRTEFIDRAGILRDMVQNHLMQILSLLLMDMPDVLNDNNIRDAKVAVIKSLKKITPENVQIDTIKGQYCAGSLDGIEVPAYKDEVKGQSDGSGETYVAIRAFIDNEKWKDVPIYLKTGKRLFERSATIDVIFDAKINQKIHIEIQPNIIFENLTEIDDLIKSSELNQHKDERLPEAYEYLIHQVIKGKQAYFVRDDEILASWEWIDSIREAWKLTGQNMVEYKAGSKGPELK